MSTHDAAAPSVTLDIPSAKTPAARQPRVGSCSCFRQLRAQGYGHVSSSWLVELRCRSRSHVPAPAVLHPCDAPCHPRRLMTPAAWSGGRKPARGTAQLSISRPRGPGRSAGALGVVDARASRSDGTVRGGTLCLIRVLVGRATTLPPGRTASPKGAAPRQGAHSSPTKSSYRKAVEHQLFMWGVLFDSEHTFKRPTIKSGLFHGLVTVK